MDITYRNDLRELNELNFARFDAKQEQQMAELRTELVRWMFAFWVTNFVGVAGLLIALRGHSDASRAHRRAGRPARSSSEVANRPRCPPQIHPPHVCAPPNPPAQ